MPTVADITGGAAGRIGGYFSVVSALPSGLFVVLLYLLVKSGAWSSSPQWADAAGGLASISVGAVLGLALGGLVLGLMLHPLQFALVQLFEGYWGVSALALRARAARAEWHRERRWTLKDRGESTRQRLEEMATVLPMDLLAIRDETARLLESYPADHTHVMPTRLGNVLRRYEVDAGARYGLNAPRVLAHLALVSPPEHIKYLNDQRTLLDLTVRFSVMSLLGTGTAVLFLWRHGLWLLLAVLLYGLAYLFYRGAVVVAHQYGIAIAVVVDLNRFALYERLHVAAPSSSHAERLRNAALGRLLAFDPTGLVSYDSPPPAAPTTPGPAAGG